MRLENPRLLAAFAEMEVEYCRGESVAEWTSLGVGGTTDILVIRQPRHLQPGDALLTVGAGSIWKAAEELAERLPAALGVTNAT